MLLTLFSLAGTLEAHTLGRARRAIEALMTLRPETALLRGADGTVREVPVTELTPGDIAALRPGARVPADGIIRAGRGGRGARVLGAVRLADEARASATAALADLRAAGVGRIVMMTGDRHAVAARIGAGLGIAPGDIHADMLPQDKVAAVAALAGQGRVAFVGDGVNDAAALARADMSIARGAMALLVAGGLFFDLPLPLAVIGHEGGTVLVVLNGLRLLRDPIRRPAAGAATA